MSLYDDTLSIREDLKESIRDYLGIWECCEKFPNNPVFVFRASLILLSLSQTIHIESKQSVAFKTQTGEKYGQNVRCKVFFKVS